MHRRLGCPVLEVSELSIEEISHRIIQLVERRKAEGAAREAEAARSDVALGRLVHGARRGARPLLRAVHAVLVRPARAGLARRVPGAASPRPVGSCVPWPSAYVYDFDEPAAGGRELLGGKGIGLAEMTQLGVPVPAGFTITTDACRAYMARAMSCPHGLEDEVDEHVRRLEERTGKRFGSSDDPLLVSVRPARRSRCPG